jgi:hypothetical protein
MLETNKNGAADNKRSKTIARLLGVVVALQVLTILGQWVSPGMTQPAQAQIPDAGAQQNQMINELKGVNTRLDHLVAILETGKLQVRVDSPDAKKDAR